MTYKYVYVYILHTYIVYNAHKYICIVCMYAQYMYIMYILHSNIYIMYIYYTYMYILYMCIYVSLCVYI